MIALGFWAIPIPLPIPIHIHVVIPIPILRADSLHAYVFTVAYTQAQATPSNLPQPPTSVHVVTRREKIKMKESLFLMV